MRYYTKKFCKNTVSKSNAKLDLALTKVNTYKTRNDKGSIDISNCTQNDIVVETIEKIKSLIESCKTTQSNTRFREVR